MKGENWDGRAVDFRETISPLIEVMKRRQQQIGVSGAELSRRINGDAGWLNNRLRYLHNPSVARLAIWAAAIEVDEFGLVCADTTDYDTFPIYDTDLDPPWERMDGKLVPNLRPALEPFRQAMVRRRELAYRTAEDFAHSIGRPRETISTLEGGRGLQNPTLVRLTAWVQALGIVEFGPYVIIGGVFTDANLLEEK